MPPEMEARPSAIFWGAWMAAAAAMTGCSTAGRTDPVPLGSGGLSSYYGEKAGVSPMTAASVTFHDSGPAIKAAMLDLVRQARRFILIDTFLLTDGPEARPVLDALVEKHRQGVRVHLIGDASSRFVPETAAFAYLESHGIPCAEFNPFHPHRLILGPKLLERDHRKFWIVDGEVLFLGGANLNDPSLAPPEAGGNRDLMVKLESPKAAGEMISSFIDTWNECPGVAPLKASEFATSGHPATEGVRFWLFDQESIGWGSENTDEMMNGLFASARREVWLIQPYTFVNLHILDHVRDLCQRGVRVHVILSNQARAPRFRYASYYGIRDLIQAGATVWIYDSAVSPLHYKCALVDDRLAYVGSANLNYRSYRLARELNVVLEDGASIAEIERIVDSVAADSRTVSKEEANRYRGPRFFTWWLLMQPGG